MRSSGLHKKKVLQMNHDAHRLKPGLLWVVIPQNHGETIRDDIFPGLQRDRSQTGQAYSGWLGLSSTYVERCLILWFFILRIAVLYRGLIFQPVLASLPYSQTCTKFVLYTLEMYQLTRKYNVFLVCMLWIRDTSRDTAAQHGARRHDASARGLLFVWRPLAAGLNNTETRS